MNTFIGRRIADSATLQIDYDGTITAVDELISPPETTDYVAPGFIDVQVNGFAGVDYNDPASSSDAMLASIRTMAQTGVTRCFPTVITGSFERMSGALRNLAAAKERWADANLPETPVFEAFHIEGSYISPEDGPRGAHPIEHVRPPDSEEFDRLQEAAQGNIRLVTVSPEWPQTPEFVKHLCRRGVVASVGHTRANSDQIRAAVDAGATMSTHLGNAGHNQLPKTNNYIWDQLADDRLTASFIVDGIHLSPAFTRAAIRAKGLERSVLVTDAVMPAMCEPGSYRLGQVDVELKPDGSVRLKNGDRLAGSGLRMDDAIGNTVATANISLHEAIVLATINAARVCRIPGRQRGITTGEKADLIRFRWDESAHKLRILETICAGKQIYKADNAN